MPRTGGISREAGAGSEDAQDGRYFARGRSR